MPISRIQCVILLLGGVLLVNGADVVYVTDLTIFTELAPCAASAISYNVMDLTYSNCPQAVTALQSCVCSKNNNFASISTALSSSVSYSCGSTASADQASAAHVLKAYCNQESIAPFPQPTQPVNQYVTDVAEFAELAPCVASAVSYNIMSMLSDNTRKTYSLCPAQPSLLATCVCEKNQNSLLVSQGINTSARYSCSSHTVDISSAQAFFSAYCAMNNGTSSFPVTSDPPGDMTYFITGLPEYSSLAPCAASAVSYGVFSNTYDLCPGGPKALASCACLKDGMPSFISDVITSNVKYSCDSTATEDVSSALAVWNLYCSAAKGLVTPTGITDSIAQPSATAKAGSGAGNSVPQATATGTGTGGLSGLPGTNAYGTNMKPMPVGVIVGGIVVAVVALGALSGIYFCLWRRRKAREQQLNQSLQQNLNNGPFGGGNNTYDGKPELDSTVTAITRPTTAHSTAHSGYGGLSPSPSMIKLVPMPPRASYVSELNGQEKMDPMKIPQNHSELAVNGYQYGRRPSTEAYGQQVHEAPGQQRPQIYEVPGQGIQPQRAELHGMGWHSGSVGECYEMDGGDYRASSTGRNR